MLDFKQWFQTKSMDSRKFIEKNIKEIKEKLNELEPNIINEPEMIRLGKLLQILSKKLTILK